MGWVQMLWEFDEAMCVQVDAGAEAILTQPPLLRSQFEAWYEGMTRQACQYPAFFHCQAVMPCLWHAGSVVISLAEIVMAHEHLIQYRE